jgi:arabinan endo-1,5-alpha-L-arabinosidase
LPFVVGIDSCRADTSDRVEVAGPEPAAGERRVRTYYVARHYPLTASSHQSFLDLFEAVAGDFGTRMPSSRRRAAPGASGPPFELLLSHNVSADILYGYGDPTVLRVADPRGGEVTYYLVATSGDAPESFPILRSPDLRSWQLAAFAFPRRRKPRWAMPVEKGGEYWAPDLASIGENFLLCFAARGKDQAMAIGLARSETPVGPFVPADEPLVAGGAIDPHIFIDEDGSGFLFWKKDSNDFWPSLLSELLNRRPGLVNLLFQDPESRQTAYLSASLWPWVRGLRPMERFFAQQVLIEAVATDLARFRVRLQTLQATGVGPALRSELEVLLGAMQTVIYAQSLDLDRLTLRGEPSVVLQNDLAWEGPLVEGVWVAKQHGSYYMFYSGNDFSTAQYGIGVAAAESPLGPYAKSDSPLVCSTAEWWGPGHPTLTDGPGRVHWLLFHAYRSGQVGYKEFRALLGVRLSFAEGKPTWMTNRPA